MNRAKHLPTGPSRSSQRTRALREAGELVGALAQHGHLSADFRRNITFVLRHYPNAREIARAAQSMSELQPFKAWLTPESEEPTP